MKKRKLHQNIIVCMHVGHMQKHIDEEIRRRRPLIERCYIERLIYDQIYKYYSPLHFPSKNESPTQDEGHLFRMKLTYEDFKSCFPNTELTVSIEHEENTPIQATITRIHNGSRTVIVYKKYVSLSPVFGVKIYQENVDVEKKDNKGRIYIKTSRYANPGKYVSI